MDAPLRTRRPASPARRRDSTDASWKSIELIQRGRMILDVAAADLEVSEARLGPFHETTWYFRTALEESRRSWDRLRASYGGRALEAALGEPPQTVLTLGRDDMPAAVLIPIGGKTYSVQPHRGHRARPGPVALEPASPAGGRPVLRLPPA